MRCPLIHCLMVVALLLQGFGSAWAATRMVAGEVAFAAQLAELPPCHRQAAQDERDAADGMACCGTAACHCLMACAATAGLGLKPVAIRFAPQVNAAAPREAGALQAVFYGPPLRPPATLQS